MEAQYKNGIITHEFIYEINKYEIKIVFINFQFSEAVFPFTKSYTRDQWQVLAEIEKLISEIEKKFEKNEIKT